MNEITIQVIDWISALVVIYCIWRGFKNRRQWVIYSLACFVYIFINVSKGLNGQAILNIFATFFAMKHALKRGDKNE